MLVKRLRCAALVDNEDFLKVRLGRTKVCTLILNARCSCKFLNRNFILRELVFGTATAKNSAQFELSAIRRRPSLLSPSSLRRTLLSCSNPYRRFRSRFKSIALISGEASPTFGHANAFFSVFIDRVRSQFLKKLIMIMI